MKPYEPHDQKPGRLFFRTAYEVKYRGAPLSDKPWRVFATEAEADKEVRDWPSSGHYGCEHMEMCVRPRVVLTDGDHFMDLPVHSFKRQAAQKAKS